MTLAKSIFLYLFLLVSLAGVAQDKFVFEETKADGDIPIDFITLLSDKYKNDVSTIDKKEKKKARKTKTQFYLESNFYINEVISSGNVLFNDRYTTYLNNIYKEIALKNPSLHREKIYFYAAKSTEVNAFATHSAIILINVGLLAKLTTEDEIAFVMCHEIAHVVKKHNIKQHIFNEEVDKKKGGYKKANWETKLYSKSNYSKKQESQADGFGFEYFLNTDYDPKAAISAFEKLKTANLPYGDSLEIPSLAPIKTQLVDVPEVPNLADIQIEEEEERENKSTEKEKKKKKKKKKDLSTHPALDLRVESIQVRINQVESNSNYSRTPNEVNKYAEHELPHLFLEKGMEVHTLYCLLNLMNESEPTDYQKDLMAKTLYALSQRKTYIEEYPDSVTSSYKKYWSSYKRQIKKGPKSLNRLLAWVNSMSNAQLNALALSHTLSRIKKVEDGGEAMTDRTVDLLEEYYKFYSKEKAGEEVIKMILKSDEHLLARAQKSNSSTDENNVVEPLENMIVLSPEYRQFDLRDEEVYKYVSSEEELISFSKKIEKAADMLKIDCNIISAIDFKNYTVEEFNELVLINQFLRENQITTPNCISSKKVEMRKLSEKYKTNNLSMMGVYSFVESKPVVLKVFALTYTTLIFPLLPFGVYYSFTPLRHTFNYTLLFDIEREETNYYNVNLIKMKDRRGAVNVSLYDHLKQLKDRGR